MTVAQTSRAALAKVHIAKKQLGLDDDVYRDVLERVTGKRSAADCSARELGDVIVEFKSMGFSDRRAAPRRARATRPPADGNQQRKIRALWLSLYHLGVVRDAGEPAMVAFVKRQTRVEAPQWLPAGDANKVIEGLKDWAARDGAVDWSDDLVPVKVVVDGATGWTDRKEPRLAVIRAQWRRLDKLGALKFGPHAEIERYGQRITGLGSFIWYESADFDKLIEALGRWIRGAIASAEERR